MKILAAAVAAPMLILASQVQAQTADPPTGVYVGAGLTRSHFDSDSFDLDDVDSNDPQEKYRQAVSDIIGGPAAAEEWAGKVLESWRDTVKGWLMVRWE